MEGGDYHGAKGTRVECRVSYICLVILVKGMCIYKQQTQRGNCTNVIFSFDCFISPDIKNNIVLVCILCLDSKMSRM